MSFWRSVPRFAGIAVDKTVAEYERHEFRTERAKFRRLLAKTRPAPVADAGEVSLRLLFGKGGMWEAIAMTKSLARFAPGLFDVVVHDDGSLDASDEAALREHLPGTRVIARAEADAAVLAHLEAAGLRRCLDFRRTRIHALKLFDLRHYARDVRVLYSDSDILFFREPTELLRSLTVPAAEWVCRYNVDIQVSQAWDPGVISEVAGVALPPTYNSGLFTMWQRGEPRFELFERCLAVPFPTVAQAYFIDQTLNAIDAAASGVEPLPLDYDVSFRVPSAGKDYATWIRRARGGADVTSQHYCGGRRQRILFYKHFNRILASELR